FIPICVKLIQAYMALAAVLLFAGRLFYNAAPSLKSFRRSKGATMLLLLLAVGWFVLQLLSLPEPDLAGLPRLPVIIIFAGASLATYFVMPDFLSVRALGVLMLFLARQSLDAGYRHLPYSLVDASISYGLLVIFGFWWAVSPVAFNAHCDWVLASPARHKTLGVILYSLAIACIVQAALLP
ncbi:MAG: hypothetical protein WCL22_00990, partial [bacterium]